MIIDTSALLAILMDGPEADRIIEAISLDKKRLMSSRLPVINRSLQLRGGAASGKGGIRPL